MIHVKVGINLPQPRPNASLVMYQGALCAPPIMSALHAKVALSLVEETVMFAHIHVLLARKLPTQLPIATVLLVWLLFHQLLLQMAHVSHAMFQTVLHVLRPIPISVLLVRLTTFSTPTKPNASIVLLVISIVQAVLLTKLARNAMVDIPLVLLILLNVFNVTFPTVTLVLPQMSKLVNCVYQAIISKQESAMLVLASTVTLVLVQHA